MEIRDWKERREEQLVQFRNETITFVEELLKEFPAITDWKILDDVDGEELIQFCYDQLLESPAIMNEVRKHDFGK